MKLRPGAASLYDLSPGELREVLHGLGQPEYRWAQISDWLYRQWCDEPERMTNLPAALRRTLAEQFPGRLLRLLDQTASRDGLTTKYLFELSDGERIETVRMRYLEAEEPERGGRPLDTDGRQGRHALCLSTQVGCAMGCRFCATGQMGFRRNLRCGEYLAQVAYCASELAQGDRQLTHVVLMGMGEPLANWEATRAALARLLDPAGAHFSPRRVTVSTVGLVSGIRRLAQSGLRVRLAVSLHAADDELRRELVPVARRYPLDELLAACREYRLATGRRVSFEYALIDGWNDQPQHARALVRRLAGLGAHVNLIPLNPTPGCELRASPPAAVKRFQVMLERSGIAVSVRHRRGIDIQAGCGQLAAQRPSAASAGEAPILDGTLAGRLL